jgi:beta-lactamase class A
MIAQTLQPVRDSGLDACLVAGFEAAGFGQRAAAYLCAVDDMRFGKWRAHENIYPASVIKVPIMAEVFHRYELGTLAPSDEVVITQSNQTTTDGPNPFVPGYVARIQELVDLMIAWSDNVATNQLMDILRRETVTEYMHGLGLSTFLLGRKLSGSEPLIEDREMVGRNRLPAAEIGRLLLLIARDAIPGAAQQREILARCVHNDKLVPGLRPGDTFRHKTGETSEQSHDAGILTTAEGKRYVVVLQCEVDAKPDNSDAAWFNPSMTQWMRVVRERL